jgi:hypothetical protein
MSDLGKPFPTVQLDDALVSMASVAELRARAKQLDAEAVELEAAASRSRRDAVASLAEAGLVLVARASEWSAAEPGAAHQLADAHRMIRTIDELDGGFDPAAGQKRSGLAGMFGRKKAPAEAPEARQARAERTSQMRVMLAELGRSYGASLPAVSAAHEKAMALEDQAVGDAGRARELEAEVRDLRRQADTRERALAEMGFDALQLAASWRLEPPAPVTSPLALRGGEIAYLAEPAELARQKTPASRPAQAPVTNLPAFTTGIRYRIGLRRDQAIKPESLSVLGPGTFVVTNQRVGFVGKLKSFAFPLDSLIHIELQTGGLFLLREGREHADVVLTPAASRLLFYINWVMQLPRD